MRLALIFSVIDEGARLPSGSPSVSESMQTCRHRKHACIAYQTRQSPCQFREITLMRLRTCSTIVSGAYGEPAEEW